MNAEALDETMQRAIASGPFAPTWQSLVGYTAPAWYEDGKFGIFVHWGPYSVPAFESECITSLAESTGLYPAPIRRVELLGSNRPLSWVRDAAGLRVDLPVDKPCEQAGVLKITL